MELEFRNLYADEIDARIGRINKGGVSLLLYKDARCDQIILDEAVGPTRWQRHHSRDNANCIVSIFDPDINQWIEKEDTGTESFTEKEKGLASDSFKRACVNWGIGRELYTAPNIFIPKENLKSHGENNGKWTCSDSFRVSDIIYYGDTKRIKSVTIEILYYGDVHHKMTFENTLGSSVPTQTKSSKSKSTPQPSAEAKAPESTSNVDDGEQLFKDDEVLLLGNCRGKKYGDVKGSAVFKSFLNWVKTSNTSYPDEAQNAQFMKLKKLAQSA